MAVDFTVGFTAFDVCAQPYTAIHAIQGSGATVALTGSRTTQGVVVGDYEGASPALRGFFIQDPTGDGNPATSDGIFVFEGSNADTVSLGDVVRVTGNGGREPGPEPDQRSAPSSNAAPARVTPTDVTFPVASADFLEQYEGMLVRLPQTMYVTEHFQLGRFGQVVLSAGGRLSSRPMWSLLARRLMPSGREQSEQDHPGRRLAGAEPRPDPLCAAAASRSRPATRCAAATPPPASSACSTTPGRGNSASGNAYRVRPVNALGGYCQLRADEPAPGRSARRSAAR